MVSHEPDLNFDIITLFCLVSSKYLDCLLSDSLHLKIHLFVLKKLLQCILTLLRDCCLAGEIGT